MNSKSLLVRLITSKLLLFLQKKRLAERKMNFTDFVVVTQQYRTERWIILLIKYIMDAILQFCKFSMHLSKNVSYLFKQMSVEKHLKSR